MRIEQREDIVIIDGLEISGTIQKNQQCPSCQNSIIYDDTFDSYFCAMCNEWQEDVMTRIVTIVFNVQNAHCKSIAKFFSFLVFDKEFTIRYSN